MTQPRFRSVITGGPGVGKSTLLAAITARGISTFAEVARAILQSPGGMEMREQRPADFAEAMLEAELGAWHEAESSPSLYDRGFPDIVGFLQLEGLPIPEDLDRCCHDLRYEGPIFRAPPWPEIYAQDDERIQDWTQALESDAAIAAAWKHYGYQLIDVPLVAVEERADFVVRQIEEAS
jgi:predicted ATPase